MPLNIVGAGPSAVSSVISPGVSVAPSLFSDDAAITTDAKSAQTREIGKKRILMVWPRSPEARGGCEAAGPPWVGMKRQS